MSYPGGSGTGVIGFAVISKLSGGTTNETQQPIPLLSGFGQVDRQEFGNIFIDSTGYCYFRTVSAIWTIGNPTSAFMGLEYLGPPLVNA
jgi:hypothetical protein